MSKKNKIILYIWIGLIGLILIFLALMKLNEKFAVIGKIIGIILCIYSIFVLFLAFYERRQLIKNYKLIGADFDRLLEFCKKGINKYWIAFIVSSCRLQLAICYLMKNEVELARKELLSHKVKSVNKLSIYPNFILGLIDEDKERAYKFYNRLMTFKAPIFNPQKDSARRIVQMIETKVCDEELLNGTKYLPIKELCLKYK